ncbi:MAG TPA: ABC transporter ATP-binding protein [Armatimonadota bacterium]|nr:ABC transporter ATP-binding protein [Armatimonadota bacterium]HOM81077.1 ABC transporter ATP-binding protein [Armatimonadota bacterium]HPO73998.1 ABC transporter ATP-binding protein [Armatimonadota bacterium]HPT97060.1 ABC transporter ATP-binding protein [Armatimonadota bacterium]
MITIQHLRKEYKTLVAVDDLCLHLEEGDIFGFIGPNGAGKTTTIKMLATLLRPTSGTATIAGFDIVREPEAVRAVIGYMPDFFGVYDDIKVWEYLDFFAAAYKIPTERRHHVVQDVLELTDLTGKRDAYVEELSRGMKQRLCLAKTLVHDPKVLLLDEPASGLDPRARIEIKELLKELKSMGKTILISSHILPELADFCNKIGIIEKGKLVISGGVQEIMRQVRGGRVLLVRVLDEPDRAIELLETMEGILSASVDEVHSAIRIEFAGDETAQHALLRRLIENGVRVQSFDEVQTDLEEIFMKVTRGIVS